MESNPEVKTRLATICDVDALFEMIFKSTDGETRLDPSILRRSLFEEGLTSMPEVKSADPCIVIDLKKLSTNAPAAQVILAEVGSKAVGYALYQYHYSPWIGHSVFIRDSYVEPPQRNKGVFMKMIQEVSKRGREDGSKMLMFSSSRMSESLFDYIKKKYDLVIYRNEETDWSIYRFSY